MLTRVMDTPHVYIGQGVDKAHVYMAQGAEAVTRCWADSWNDELWGEEPRSSCLLEGGHRGPHEWTPDSEIVLEFAE